MLDINLLRQEPQVVKEGLAKKGFDFEPEIFLQIDSDYRKLLFEAEQLKAEKNKASAEIPRLKKLGEDASDIMARMKEISVKTKLLEEQISVLKAKQQEILDSLPNLPANDVVAGGKENNEVVKVVGSRPEFDFAPQHHVDIVENLGIIDYTRGAKLGGSGFWLYRREGALLEWALLNYFMQAHLRDGYEMMLPPHILTYQCGYTAGQFPKFKDDIFQLRKDEGEDFTHFILPTAETALVNLHRDEILNEADLPLKYFAYTPCYRKEAGSYRAEERGMIRGHQFNKVEMFQYATPEQADAALDELVGKAAALVEGLGLHFQVSKLAAGDCSASMVKTFDIEVFIPSMNDYKEVSSASNAGDYQARRGNMRFRRQTTGKTEFIHTLNASGLATSRVLPAIMEHYQQADGSVIIPELLRPWMDNKERITKV